MPKKMGKRVMPGESGELQKYISNQRKTKDRKFVIFLVKPTTMRIVPRSQASFKLWEKRRVS